MAAGYSSVALHKKLGLKEAFNMLTINAPVNYIELIGEITDKIHFKNRLSRELDFIHFFTNSTAELEAVLPQIKQQIKKQGMIWISWYKKNSGKTTELHENLIRDIALYNGLVDVKVCAVDEDWSGLKLVFRLKDRK